MRVLGKISYQHIGVSPDLVDPEPTTIVLNCDEFFKGRAQKPSATYLGENVA